MADLRSLEAAGFKAGGRSEDQKKAEESRAAAEDARRAMLSSIMNSEARERLNRVAIVKPDNARAVEEHLIKMARAGKIKAQVTEDDIVRMLDDVGGALSGVVKKVVITRKKRADEDDDDDDDL